MKPWTKLPFSINEFTIKENIKTKLPFSIGCASRQGIKHKIYGINNQDGISIHIADDIMIGVVCDGATLSEDILYEFSANHVGGTLLPILLKNILIEEFSKKRRKRIGSAALDVISKKLGTRLKKLLNNISKDKEIQTSILYNLFTATIIGFIIRDDEYLVFNCGDGVIQINEEIIDLSKQSGRYFSSDLLEDLELKESLRLIEKGKTSDLKNLCIASDGFCQKETHESDLFQNFVRRKTASNGFEDLCPSFHLEFLNSYLTETDSKWPDDDASFILVTRTTK